MDWVILITAMLIIAVTSRSIENAPCNRSYESKLSLNQSNDPNYSSFEDMKETDLKHDNCTSETDNQTNEDHKKDQSKEIITNIPEVIIDDDASTDDDENNGYNVNLTRKNETKTSKREKAIKVDRSFNQNNITKEIITRNASVYISDDVRGALSNSKSKKNSITEDSNIYVFKDTLHPIYQIKRVNHNDLRSIRLNKRPKITILRRKMNNKHVINKQNEGSSSANKINVKKNEAEVKNNLLDHLLEYFIKIMQDDKNKKIKHADEENINVGTGLRKNYDSRVLDDADIEAPLISDRSSDNSLHSSDELNNINTTNSSISEVDYNLEENTDDIHQDENQSNLASDEHVISDININSNDSIANSYTDRLGIDNDDAETINDDTSANSDDISTDNTNNEVNNTESNIEIDIDLNISKNINTLLENVDYINGTTIDIDIPITVTEAPLIKSTNTTQNLRETSDFNETKIASISDVSEVEDEINEEVKETEQDDSVLTETTALRSTLYDGEDSTEQTRRILLGRLDTNKIKDEKDEHIKVNGNCDKPFRMHIDIDVF